MADANGLHTLTIKAVRAAWHRDAEQWRCLQQSFTEHPGRAAGRVACWAIERCVEILRVYARRELAIGRCEEPNLSFDEAHLVDIVCLLQRGDGDHARLRARWLVRAVAANRLVERIEPLAATLANRASGSSMQPAYKTVSC